MEILGTVVLCLVITALLGLDIASIAGTRELTTVVYILALLVTTSIPMAILHITKRLGKYSFYRFWFGFLLLVSGGAVFYFVPSYFYQLLSVDLPFWFKVSIYSLPAICVEGGLFTLFTDFMESERRVTPREYGLLSFAFLLYTAGSVTANFMVILGNLAISHQILFARLIVTAVIVLGGAVIITHRQRISQN